MANSRDTGPNREYATVDTAPAAAGFFTTPMTMRGKKVGNQLFFSIRDGGASQAWAATLTLQFRCKNDAGWTDYDTYTNTDIPRKLIEGQAGDVSWRLGIKQGDFVEGIVTFGFDW